MKAEPPAVPGGRGRRAPVPLLIATIAVLAGATLAACSSDANGARRVAVGDPAPAYAAPDLDGDTLALADLRGRVVLVNVWATWCAPCRREMPGLQALQDSFGTDELRVVGVSIDARGAESAIREFTRELGVAFTILHDPDERVTRAFRTIDVPESFLIDRQGVVAGRWIGLFDPTDPATAALVRAAVTGAAPAEGP